MTAPSFYEVLGVAATCSAEDVRRAYHQAARKYHPDKRSSDVNSAGANSEDEQQFLRVQEAYETLRRAELRRQYDAKLQQDELVRKREQEVVVVSDEVPLADMLREVLPGEGEDEDEVVFTHQCRCGDLYEITEEELQDGADVVPCTGCSLHIRVLLDKLPV
ncbi:DnaJ sub C member 24 [Phytophthora pseudosyringae]|uniref:DnaJ sub C member 24 n=1 Tax=Phytophthora pseudosyringae TaxID=221518 RepID=A0A8T1WA37_9STRA|nr:DnaJ sub C member 24 [Phytophthora pseudosyringae]